MLKRARKGRKILTPPEQRPGEEARGHGALAQPARVRSNSVAFSAGTDTVAA